jgi:hypothetical protein
MVKQSLEKYPILEQGHNIQTLTLLEFHTRHIVLKIMSRTWVSNG